VSQEKIARAGGELLEDPGPDGLITRGFLRGAGWPASMVRRRPVIGIANTWSELNPCNGGLRDLAGAVKSGVIAAGGLPLEFPTISIAEAFTRPSSLYLRNLLAMDTEEMVLASPIDGVVLLGGCDKTLPAQLMGAASAGKPAITLAAGPRPLSTWEGQPMTIEALWPLIDQRRMNQLDDDSWSRLEGCLSAGPGTCNVMGTALTMAVIAEILGMALPGSSLLAAGSPARTEAAKATGARAVTLVAEQRTPADVITDAALRNAFRGICAVGGSTNAVIHLQAIAGRLGRRLTTEQLRQLSSSTPMIADVKPSGEMLLQDLELDGGIPALMGRLRGIMELDSYAGDGRRWADAASDPRSVTGCLKSPANPAHRTGSLALLTGTLAPSGAILKRSAATPRLCQHRGRAVVFSGVEDMRARIDDPAMDIDADSVLVLRGAGPLGGPGMPEVGHLPIPARLLSRGVTDMVRISDARMSGTATGTVVLHVSPEAAVGGPLALVRDGDVIDLDADAGRLDLLVGPDELQRRQIAQPRTTFGGRGFEFLYRNHVTQADTGCDFDFLQA
jgi:dihydroxy-acid dehydratase